MKKRKEIILKDLILENKSMRYNNKIKRGERIDYEDFKFLIEIHLEFIFSYQDKMCEIVWGEQGLEFCKDQNPDYTSQEWEIYPTGEDFLANARIDGQRIEDIFDLLDF